MSSKPWYRWFSADYRAKTAHLDFIHDAAYRRLLDAYYEHRGPLPSDPKALCRIAGAQTPDERAAVIAVAEEFFTNGDDRIRQARADQELAEAQNYHQRMVEAGSKGGLSSAQARLKPRSTHSQPQSQPQSDSQPQPLGEVSPKPPLLGQARELLAFLNEKSGKNFRPTKVNLELIMARLKEGYTPVECRGVIVRKCREWTPDPKMAPYLRPATLFGREKFNQYVGDVNAKVP